ncbi:glycosyltransferase [Variovorax sp. J22G21]|uniref:glycosyltransferase n=1 Tax=Variovorax fucosicus TaxID=3053517 RepID=UPI002574B834|nr:MULTISPECIES: glycosyltransferase [unclassified Variovorax]MDM0038518.1 glycosyltransferase [Variovorax sp. J22R193]MDM0063294.1 glycosyltransferase [Variovorax sp. J22G21]
MMREFLIKKEVHSSGQFDADYYLQSNSDLNALSATGALSHFVKFGMMEGRRPSEKFDPKFYLSTIPELLDYESAFLHYIRHGVKEGKPGIGFPEGSDKDLTRMVHDSGLFDWQFYATAYIDVPFDAQAALDHFMAIGMAIGRQPSMQFRPDDYCSENPEVRSRAEALLDCIHRGQLSQPIIANRIIPIDYIQAAKKIKNSKLFDEDFYVSQLPASDLEQWDPVMHYLATGAQFCTEVNSKFSLIGYLAKYPDLRAACANPLLHWLDSGRIEHRDLPNRDLAPVWEETNRNFPLPDDCVKFELIAGQAFFRGYGFDFVNRNVKGYVTRCISDLSRATLPTGRTGVGARVSVIIPVYGQIDYVLSCLDSLSKHRSIHLCEIIVCDDASPDANEMTLLSDIPWIKYLRRAQNGGFIDCCNYAASQATGEILIFLNSDTRVVEGWLDELVWGFDNLENAGLVGSKLLNADGTLQEAGGIIFQSGAAHNYGRGQDSNDPRYCFSRQADYISGASIGITRELWETLGGFDRHFFPAYCEDVDLAFKVRQAGYKVWYQPFSRVVHYEGITHGRDVNSGTKAYQIENLRKILIRYGTELADHAPAATSPHEAATFRLKKRMLVVDALTPTPDRDSGSIMTSEVMRTYRKLGFEQHFVSACFPQWLEKYSYELQRNGTCCHYAPFSPGVGSIARSTGAFELALIYRHDVAQLVYDKIRKRMPEARVIFANVDLHYLREMRGAEVSGDQRALNRAQFTKTSELGMFVKADAAFVHTAAEREIIASELPVNLDNIIVFPWLAEIVGAANKFDQRHDLMFLGNFMHVPNIDSAIYLVKQIWPLLESKLPAHAKLYIVGNMPTPEVTALGSDRIVVTGFVEDMTPYFEKSRVFLAPLRYGAGIKGKIVTAFAHGVPCVATPVAAEGIGSDHDPHIAVEGDVESFARAALKLYFNEDEWSVMQKAAFSYLEKSYSRAQAEELCLKGYDVAGRIWTRRYEHKRVAALAKILQQQGDRP